MGWLDEWPAGDPVQEKAPWELPAGPPERPWWVDANPSWWSAPGKTWAEQRAEMDASWARSLAEVGPAEPPAWMRPKPWERVLDETPADELGLGNEPDRKALPGWARGFGHAAEGVAQAAARVERAAGWVRSKTEDREGRR